MENIKEIVEKLVGNIQPAGESNLDTQRLENLKVMCGLVEDLVWEINQVSKDKDRYESSMKVMGVYANNFMYNLINEYIYDTDSPVSVITVD